MSEQKKNPTEKKNRGRPRINPDKLKTPMDYYTPKERTYENVGRKKKSPDEILQKIEENRLKMKNYYRIKKGLPVDDSDHSSSQSNSLQVIGEILFYTHR